MRWLTNSVMILSVFCISAVRADIFEWEYINPGNTGQGK